MEASASPQQRRLRSACDLCHASKVRCTGGQPCKKCCNSNLPCTYSYMAKLGKPKGSRNKRTLERLSVALAGGANPTLHSSTEASTNNLFQGDRAKTQGTHQDHQEKVMLATTIPPSSDTSASSATAVPITASSCAAFTPVINDPGLDLSIELASILDFEVPPLFSRHSPTESNHQIRLLTGADYLNGLFTGDSSTDPLPNGQDGDVDATYRSQSDVFYDAVVNKSPSSWIPRSNSVTPNFSFELYKWSNQVPITREGSNCICLKMLTGMQCSLSGIERRRGIRHLDIILSMATMILDCSGRALACNSCLLDAQVLLLIIILLQTVFNWAIVNCNNAKSHEAHQPPPIKFGTWNVSEEEGRAVKIFLVNRIIAKTGSTIGMIHQRIDEISSLEDQSEWRYQPIDSQILHVTLKRVIDALAEVRKHGREMGICY
ncbi:hypothetical protein V8C42DRAFT_333958, partial [Trichoderma barbatum]